MRKNKEAVTYWQKVRWWALSLLLAWGALPRWWRANDYAWRAAAHSLIELFGLIIAPLLVLFSPLLALLECWREKQDDQQRLVVRAHKADEP